MIVIIISGFFMKLSCFKILDRQIKLGIKVLFPYRSIHLMGVVNKYF